MNLGQILDYANYKLNKDYAGNTLTPDNYNLILPVINVEYLKWKYGLPEQFRVGQPFAPQQWEVAQKITDDLYMFKKMLGGNSGNPALQVDTYGVAAIPSDYLHVSSIRYDEYTNTSCNDTTASYSIKTRVVETIPDAELGGRLSNSNRYPSKKYPVCTQYPNYFQFYPNDLQYVIFTYIRMPSTPYYDYDIVNDAPVYLPPGSVHTNNSVEPSGSPSLSVELEWPLDTHPDIAELLVNIAAGSLRDTAAYQISTKRKEGGI
jgi:hypothetical protein